MTTEQQIEDGLLDTERAARWLGIKPRTLTAYRATGAIPFVQLGPKLIRYRLEDLQRYANAHLQTVEQPAGENAA